MNENKFNFLKYLIPNIFFHMILYRNSSHLDEKNFFSLNLWKKHLFNQNIFSEPKHLFHFANKLLIFY